MPKYPTPDHEGHWWAKLVHPTRMPEGEDWASVDWEVVQVFDNNGPPGDPEEFGVHVPGVRYVQWVQDFVWGPEVLRPAELSRALAKESRE